MNSLIRSIVVGLPLWLLAFAVQADTNVYMLGKLNIQGTTYTQLVFFSDKNITTLEACEKEVMSGRTGQWQHYEHLANKVAGMSVAVNYLCRASGLAFSGWQSRERYSIVYRVDIRDGGMTLVEHDTYAECIGYLKQHHVVESYEYFCAKASQKIVNQ